MTLKLFCKEAMYNLHISHKTVYIRNKLQFYLFIFLKLFNLLFCLLLNNKLKFVKLFSIANDRCVLFFVLYLIYLI